MYLFFVFPIEYWLAISHYQETCTRIILLDNIYKFKTPHYFSTFRLLSLIAIMLSKELIFLQVFLDDEFSTDFSASVDEAEDFTVIF